MSGSKQSSKSKKKSRKKHRGVSGLLGSSQRPIAQIPLSHPNSNSKCQMKFQLGIVLFGIYLSFDIWHLFLMGALAFVHSNFCNFFSKVE
jgi:hypothetical protein